VTPPETLAELKRLLVALDKRAIYAHGSFTRAYPPTSGIRLPHDTDANFVLPAEAAAHAALRNAAAELVRDSELLARLLDASPHCRWKERGRHGETVFCDRLAVVGTLTHVPEWCDEHGAALPAAERLDCDWADVVREVGR
jgi:hypothetical protein